VDAYSLDVEVTRTVQAATLLVLTPESSGTGFVVAASPDTLWVLTNDHVINSGLPDLPAWVVLRDKPWRMKVVLRDPTLDLALLESHTAPSPLPPVLPLSDGAPAPGTHVAAAGFPGGFTMARRGTLPNLAMSTGQVRPEFPEAGRALLDVGVYPGSSGGPVVDGRGNAVGVVVAHVRGTLLTQMIPSARAREFLKRALPENALPTASAITGMKPVAPSPQVTGSVLAGLAVVELRDLRVAAPVVRQREGRVYLLAAGPVARALDRAGAAPRAWRAIPGPSAALEDLRVERTIDFGASGVAVLSARAPATPITPVELGSATQLLPTAPLLIPRAEDPVHLTARPFMRWLAHERRVAHAFLVDVGVGARREGDPVFHFETGALLGFVTEPVSDFPAAYATPLEAVMEEGQARLRTATLTREGCELVGTLDVDDPLGTVEEAGLIMEEPGGPSLFTGIYDALPIGPVAVRADLAPSPFQLRAPLGDCSRPLAAQLYMATKGTRWFSLPVQVPVKPEAPLALPAGERVWVRSSTRDSAGLREWRRPEVTTAPADLSCLPPPGALEPEAVYLSGRSSDGRCPGQVVRREDGSGSDSCIMLPPLAWQRFVFVQPDGALGYAGEWGDVRVHVPDALTRVRPSEACRPATTPEKAWHWNDPALMTGACSDAPGGQFHGFFTWPDGRAVATCGKNHYVAPWAPQPWLQGGGLVRLGHDGHVLVTHPFGGLAVLDPNGLGAQVVGLGHPAPRQVFASAATPSGFLAIFKQPGDSQLPEPDLFAIGFDGSAVRRGALPPLPAGLHLKRTLLDVTGALHVLAEVLGGGERQQVLVLRPGRPLRVVYDDGQLKPEQRLKDLILLSGGASTPAPVPPQHAVGREEAEKAGWRFRKPPRLEGPCASTLSHLRPDAVYVREGRRVFDPRQPGLNRQSSADLNNPRVTGDGRIVYPAQERGPENSVRTTVREYIGDHAWPTQWGGCGEQTYGINPDPVVGDPYPCGDAVLQRVLPHPDSGELSLVCGTPSQGVDLLRGGKRTRLARDSIVLHGGADGSVLLREEAGYAILSSDGTRIPVRGLPARGFAHITRARGRGFDVVLEADASRQLVLWNVSAKGQATRVAAYAPSISQVNWGSGVLGSDRALYAIRPDGTSRRIFRWRPGAREAQLAWTLPAGSYASELLSGP
jgi:S1-C subfamily serine protease